MYSSSKQLHDLVESWRFRGSTDLIQTQREDTSQAFKWFGPFDFILKNSMCIFRFGFDLCATGSCLESGRVKAFDQPGDRERKRSVQTGISADGHHSLVVRAGVFSTAELVGHIDF